MLFWPNFSKYTLFCKMGTLGLGQKPTHRYIKYDEKTRLWASPYIINQWELPLPRGPCIGPVILTASWSLRNYCKIIVTFPLRTCISYIEELNNIKNNHDKTQFSFLFFFSILFYTLCIYVTVLDKWINWSRKICNKSMKESYN